MLSWIAHFVGTLGYTGVALLMALENIVFPLPSELIMPLAGFLAGRGYMTLPGVIIAGTIGSVAGALPVYWIAQEVGEQRIASWIERHGWWLRIRARDIQRADAQFKLRGGRAVFLAQLIPGARVLIAIPAGIARMNLTWFVLTNLAGTLIWCSILSIAGQQLGVHFVAVPTLLRPLAWIAGGAGLAALGVWTWHQRRRRDPARPLQPAERRP
jgi:membrane protein DedA with SNARE-associated domain